MSGKTTLLRRLQELNLFTELVSHTTRPLRTGEKDGIDYFFVSASDFHNIQMAESVFYGDYQYGLAVSTIEQGMASDKVPIVIVEPNGVQQLTTVAQDRGWNLFRVFIDVNPIVQQERFIERLLNDENANREVYLKRFRLLRSEWAWKKANEWDMIVPVFDQISERATIDRLMTALTLGMSGQQLPLPGLEFGLQ